MARAKNPNTTAATAARRKIGLNKAAEKLRAAGWTVIPPRDETGQQRPPSYGERKPVTLPDRLDDLTGPTTGTVTLPINLDWSGSPTYNLDASPRRIETLYATILAEASDPDDLARYIDRDTLIRLWPSMWLPPKVRRLWEERFPQLAATRTPKVA